eukprot:2181172-Pyramimonas_sp.AAC.1
MRKKIDTCPTYSNAFALGTTGQVRGVRELPPEPKRQTRGLLGRTEPSVKTQILLGSSSRKGAISTAILDTSGRSLRGISRVKGGHSSRVLLYEPLRGEGRGFVNIPCACTRPPLDVASEDGYSLTSPNSISSGSLEQGLIASLGPPVLSNQWCPPRVLVLEEEEEV